MTTDWSAPLWFYIEEKLYLTELFSLRESLREKTPEEAVLLHALSRGGPGWWRQADTDTATDLSPLVREEQ